MTDVFISYSRKDKAFVQVLNQALANSKYDAWVDWENIPLTADWWEEIKAGIEAADTFIFVISPDSIASKVCGQEIDHAVENNKRLVPIVRREGFETSLVRPALGIHNWLYFRDEDDFDTTFQSLVDTLNTDLVHVKTHTQLLVKALEWQHKERTSDLLLRGSQLEAILSWITTSADKEPRLTKEQREYVAASSKAEKDTQAAEIARQQAEIERQKKARKAITLALIGASVGFVVATVLGFIAVKQQQLAQQRELNARLLAQSLKVEKMATSGLQIDALEEAIRGYQEIQTVSRGLYSGQRLRAIGSLQEALYGMTEQNRLAGHSKTVWDVSFSPDGKTIASASSDGTIKLWNLAGENLKTLEDHSSYVNSVSFSPDGQTLASASGDGTIKLWTLQGEELMTLEGHNNSVNSVSFSPDGQTLASASSDGTIKLWTLQGKELMTLRGHSSYVISVSFSPDGQTLASGSGDGTIKLWTLQGKELMTFDGHSKDVSSVSFSPDGQMLASASADTTIKLWNLQGKVLNTIKGHNGVVNAISFSSDGQTIASSGEDTTIKLWNLQGDELKTLRGHNGWIKDVSFSPDGQTLVSTGADTTVRLWNLQGEELKTLKGHSADLWSIRFSPDGQTFAAAGSDNTIKLWTLQGEEIRTLTGHNSGGIWDVSFSSDGQTLASAGGDATIKLWNLQGEEIRTLAGHSQRVSSISFSPDGQTLASASDDGTTKLWSLDGDLLNTFEGHEGGIWRVSFSPDGQTLASGGADGTIKLWDLQGQAINTIDAHINWVSNVVFSPNGRTLLSSSGGIIKLWNLAGEELKMLEGHSGSISSIGFNPNGQTFVSSSSDGTVKLWSIQGEELKMLENSSIAVNSISFSPDGQTLASARADGIVKLWNMDEEDLVRRSCDWLNDYLIIHPEILTDLTACHTHKRLQSAAKHLVQKSVQTASTGKTQVAEQQLTSALIWNPDVDLDPNTPESEQDAVQIALKFTAPYHRTKGQRLANQLKVEAATQAYQKTLELDPTIDLDPRTETVEQDAIQITRRYAALSQQQRGQRRARELKIEAAIQAFEEALKLDPTIDLNLDTEKIEQDAEAIAHQLSALGQIAAGQQYVKNGEIEKAIQAYNTAQKLDPEFEFERGDWDHLCWFGSINGKASAVRFACENEAKLEPLTDPTLDSRGIVLALEGDIEGAISNFQNYRDYITQQPDFNGRGSQAQAWIDALKAGQNPFTSEKIEQPRNGGF
ncbi:MAG: TIR domain-containing protein [Cyanobacteria bacterium P01_B01_bin.77]